MEILIHIYQITQFLLLIWLGYYIVYVTVLAVAGLFFKQKRTMELISNIPKIALFIPAYKENEVILHTVEEVLKHDYDKFDVVVIADSLDIKILEKLKRLNIILIEVSFKKSTKAKALNFAMDKLNEEYDLAVILDADNIMNNNALELFAIKYTEGYNAIQGHRTAKNKSTNFALLDAISEEINNHIYCKGAQMLGITSRLVGSGMAFDYVLFKKLMKEIDAVGGFDKELKLKLIELGHPIYYLNEAVIYDEKVSQSKVFLNQRKRWVSSQFYYLKKFTLRSITQLFKGKFNYFIIVAQLSFPPRLLLPIILLVLFILSNIFDNQFYTLIWGGIFCLNVLVHFISIPREFWNKNLIKAFFSLPKALIMMLTLAFNLKKANDEFIHTPHTFIKNKD